MTLVLSYVSNSFVLQVSDRRLSRGGVPLETEFNKSVVWCRLAVIGYTGFAFVNRQQRIPTDQVDEWIRRTLYNRLSIFEIIEALKQEAKKWVYNMPGDWRAQAFTIAGWAPQRSGSFKHFAALISNFHDERGNILKSIQSEFISTIISPPSEEPIISVVGQRLTAEEYRAMRRALALTKGEDPGRVSDVLVHIVRNVSRRIPSLVGQSVMVTCIPQPSSFNPAQFILTERWGRPVLDHPTFFYRDPDSNQYRGYAPLFVCGDSGHDFTIDYLNESGSDASITVSMRGPREDAARIRSLFT